MAPCIHDPGQPFLVKALSMLISLDPFEKIDFKKTFTNSGNCRYLGEHHDH